MALKKNQARSYDRKEYKKETLRIIRESME